MKYQEHSAESQDCMRVVQSDLHLKLLKQRLIRIVRSEHRVCDHHHREITEHDCPTFFARLVRIHVRPTEMNRLAVTNRKICDDVADRDGNEIAGML